MHDYLGAARRVLGVSPDRRAELYCLHTTAVVEMDYGRVAQAKVLFEGAFTLAEEMCETGIAARCMGNLCLAYQYLHEWERAIEVRRRLSHGAPTAPFGMGPPLWAPLRVHALHTCLASCQVLLALGSRAAL